MLVRTVKKETLMKKKSWIKHREAVLILDNPEDDKFLEKKEACIVANEFIAKMTNQVIKSFEDKS